MILPLTQIIIENKMVIKVSENQNKYFQFTIKMNNLLFKKKQ
jgi:hypothetical protein